MAVQRIRGFAGQGLETTDHGEERLEQSAYDPDRQVGDANRVVREGKSYRDTEKGTIAFVKGDRVVVTNSDGEVVTVLTITRRNLRERIKSGRYVPIIEPE